MGDYAKKHHPQVQARKSGIPINAFRREHYAAALESCGVKTAGLNKSELWRLVRETPCAMDAVTSRNGRH